MNHHRLAGAWRQFSSTMKGKPRVRLSMRGNSWALVVALAGILAAVPAIADNGGGKGDKRERREKADNHHNEQKGDRNHGSRRDNAHFDDRQRTIVHNYYGEQFRTGHCPPGLARKNNGCMPPGHAKRWSVGQPLPRAVIYYEVPAPVVVQLGPPPTGHRYVRVASDILLIALGTGMVIDAMQDLGRM